MKDYKLKIDMKSSSNNHNNNDTQVSLARNFNIQLKAEADDFKRQLKFVEKEKLFMELQHVKVEMNALKEDNIKFKTRIAQTEKELQRYERLCEEQQNFIAGANNGKPVSSDTFMLQLRKQNKELSQKVREKSRDVEQLKKHSKVTKYKEMEHERQAFFDESVRLKKIIEDGAAQQQQMLNKYNQSLQLENEIVKVVKINDNLINENKTLVTKSQQADEMVRQLQQLFKVNQLKSQAHEKQINELKQQIKKISVEKQNLKQTIRQMQESQYQLTPSKQPQPTTQTNKPKTINSILIEELRFKLILRGITTKSFTEMLDNLKQQAAIQQVSVRSDDIKHILTQEPFTFHEEKKINDIVNGLQGSGNAIVDHLKSIIGNYKTFHDYPTFDFQKCEASIKNQLKSHESQIQEQCKKLKIHVSATKTEVKKLLSALHFNWDEPTLLFYFLNLFEKSDENLGQIKIEDILNPFIEDDQQEQAGMPGQPLNMRISEESDEELFDRQSNDYSLDEKGVTIRNKVSEDNQEEQQIIFRDEGQIVSDQQRVEEQQQEQEQEQEQQEQAQENGDDEYQQEDEYEMDDQQDAQQQQNAQQQEQEQDEYQQDYEEPQQEDDEYQEDFNQEN